MSVCLSVHRSVSVTLVNHAQMVQYVKIPFTLNDRARFLLSWRQFPQSWVQGIIPNECVPPSLLKANVWPIIRNNFEAVRDRMFDVSYYSMSTIGRLPNSVTLNDRQPRNNRRRALSLR